MGKPNFSDEFKRDAETQITERGYPVAEVSQRLGVSAHSLYAWKRHLAKVVSGDAGKASRKLGAIQTFSFRHAPFGPGIPPSVAVRGAGERCPHGALAVRSGDLDHSS
jgi:hypothetical protein